MLAMNGCSMSDPIQNFEREARAALGNLRAFDERVGIDPDDIEPAIARLTAAFRAGIRAVGEEIIGPDERVDNKPRMVGESLVSGYTAGHYRNAERAAQRQTLERLTGEVVD